MNEGLVIRFGILGTVGLQVKVAFCSLKYGSDELFTNVEELLVKAHELILKVAELLAKED